MPLKKGIHVVEEYCWVLDYAHVITKSLYILTNNIVELAVTVECLVLLTTLWR
jgi:hypothetical protein